MGGAFVRPPKFSKLIKYFEKSSLFIVVVLEELMCISILLHLAWRALPMPPASEGGRRAWSPSALIYSGGGVAPPPYLFN